MKYLKRQYCNTVFFILFFLLVFVYYFIYLFTGKISIFFQIEQPISPYWMNNYTVELYIESNSVQSELICKFWGESYCLIERTLLIGSPSEKNYGSSTRNSKKSHSTLHARYLFLFLHIFHISHSASVVIHYLLLNFYFQNDFLI